MTHDDTTMSVKTASELLNIHPQTTIELIASGAIRAAKIGRAYVMLRSDVMRFVEDQVARQTQLRMRGITESAVKGYYRKNVRGASRGLRQK